ncbi:MAG: hypothetical protein IT462_05920 [Planctomycetes bacterium]|nr:hypothetical protein [Planctomycetota bacterium]
MNPHLDFAVHTFGLRTAAPFEPRIANLTAPEPGRVLAVVGASGAGKSRALNALAKTTPQCRTAHTLASAELERPVLSLFDASLPPEAVLRCLARVGLADARLWTQLAGTLSAGEQRRLEIARALLDTPARGLIVLDEPDAHLDETTAKILAVTLRRVASANNIRLALSTHRRNLLPWLAPAAVVEIRDGVAHELQAPAPKPHAALLDEIVVVPGRAGDYARFAHWHYLGTSKPGPSRLVLIAQHEGEPVGIAIFGHSHMLLGPRRGALPPAYWPENVARFGARDLNRDVRLLSRIIVDPRFRGVGVAGKLIADGLRQLGVPYVECLAQMGAFSSFLTSAGFVHAGDCRKPPPLVRLQAFMDEHAIAPVDLIDPLRRALLFDRLLPPARERLHKLILAAMRTRIETGHGNLRGQLPGAFTRPDLLEGVLLRLHAQPAYFLWKAE